MLRAKDVTPEIRARAIEQLCGQSPDFSFHSSDVEEALKLRRKFCEANLQWNFGSRGRAYDRARRLGGWSYAGAVLWRNFWEVLTISLIFWGWMFLLSALPGSELTFTFLGFIFLWQMVLAPIFALSAYSLERKSGRAVLADPFFEADIWLNDIAEGTAGYFLFYLSELRKEEHGKCRLSLEERERIVNVLQETIEMLEVEAASLEKLLQFHRVAVNTSAEAERLRGGAEFIISKLRQRSQLFDHYLPKYK